MKKTALFILSFIGVLILAIFLSPLLFEILPYKFERIFNRIVMIGTLVCVAVFVRMRKETWIRFGLDWKSNSLSLLIVSFLVPVLVLSVYAGIQMMMGEAVLSLREITLFKLFERIMIALFAGLLIGMIEEIFFRGVFLQGCQQFFGGKQNSDGVGIQSKSWGLALSLLVTNLFYSAVHFVNAKKPFVDDTPTFIDSCRLLVAPFSSFLHFGDFWPGFVGLFIFGLMLSGFALKTKSLYAAIGLHSGAVFFIKTDGLWVDFSTTNLIWGSGKMYDGFIGWGALGVLYLTLCFFIRFVQQGKNK